ncbi:hypothetical protein [Litoreibacter albidus]
MSNVDGKVDGWLEATADDLNTKTSGSFKAILKLAISMHIYINKP